MNVKEKILVVDDDPNLRKTLSDILKIKGYEAVIAGTGAEAIVAMESDDISLALIDLVLPDMSGIEVMARLKAISPLTEAIVLTGHASMDTAIEATRQGAFSYLLKPYNMDDLLLNIRQGIECHQTKGEILRLSSFPRLNPSPVIEVESTGEVFFLNPAAERMFPELWVLGQLHPLLNSSMEMITDLWQGRKQGEIITESAVGEATYELHISHVQDVNLIRIYVVDMTERKRGEDALREKERLLSESQRLGHIGSFLYDLTGSIQWSDELYRLYGVSPDTFTPTVESFFSLIHPDDRSAMKVWIDACIAGQKPDALDFRINMADGTVRFVKGCGDAVYDDENNKLAYIAGTMQDITERKHAEEALQRYSVELEIKNKALQEALANVKQLNGMLPICASCKKIRDDKGYWSEVESYLSEHTKTVFSHGMCPDCEKKAYQDLEDLTKENS
jgi:PAS domain S-box-containing protein